MGFRWRHVLNALPYIGFPVGMFYAYTQDPSDPQYTGWQSIGTMALGVGFARDIERFALKRPTHRWGLATRVLAFLVLAFVVPSLIPPTYFGVGVTAILVAFAAAMFAALDLFVGLPGFGATTTSGKYVQFSKWELRDATLAAAPGDPGIAMNNLRGNRRVEGTNAAKVISILGATLFTRASPPAVEHGWTLARMHGDLGGLMHALDEVRPDSAGAHHRDDLPVAWKVALNIAAVEAIGSPRDRSKIQKKIADASEVARIADTLS